MARTSVIIPTYNRAQYVAAAVESVLAQTCRALEIIVVDDGSTDETAAVLEPYLGQIIYHRQSHSGRPAAARNAGLDMATGEFVAFLDSDDVYLPERVALHIAYLDANPGAAFVYSEAEYFSDEDATVAPRPNDRKRPSGHIFPALVMDNFLTSCGVTVRRSCLATIGGFDEAPVLTGVEDYDLWLRIAARFEVGFVAGFLCRVRLHRQNISGGDKLTQYLGTLEIMRKMGRLYPALVDHCKTRWRERRSLMHLAAARAYWHRRKRSQVLVHAGCAVGVNPSPRWLIYLLTTPRPAQQWLARVTSSQQGT